MSRDDDDRSPATAGVVDFDALHAALGDLPPTAPGSSPRIGESQGRTNATYASSRPHAIPQTRPPAGDLDAPAVIIQTDDTVPSGPPMQMTVPMSGAPPYGSLGAARSRGSSDKPPSAPVHQRPFPGDVARARTTDHFQVHADLPTRPGLPRRPRTPTLMMRPRGPSGTQKFLVFLAMLIVFVGGGMAFLVYGKSVGLGIDVPFWPVPPPAHSPAPAVTALPVAAPMPTPTLAPTAAPSASASASASALPITSASAAASSKKAAPRR